MFENQIKSTPFTITAFASPLFSLPLGEDEVKWVVWLTKENIWKRFSTLSQIAILEGEALKVSFHSYRTSSYSVWRLRNTCSLLMTLIFIVNHDAHLFCFRVSDRSPVNWNCSIASGRQHSMTPAYLLTDRIP